MDVIFLSNNPVNSKVIRSEGDDGTAHAYDITTKRNPDSGDVYSTTTVRRPSGAVVALWEWSAHNRYQDRVTYLGETHVLSDWLAKESPFSRTQLVVPANGTSYRWKQTKLSLGIKLDLADSKTGQTIANAGYAQTASGSGRERRMKIVVQPEAASMGDIIVLSFVVFEAIRRERGEAKNWGAFWVGAGATGVAPAPLV